MDRNKCQGFTYLLKYSMAVFLYRLFGFFPVAKKKVVGVSMRGKKYGDNPQFIMEAIKSMRPDIDFVWLHNRDYDYNIPTWLRDVPYFNGYIKRIFEMATAKVWISSHTMEEYVRKRKNQLFVETWHGGLGIKKIGADTDKVNNNVRDVRDMTNTVNLADVFISNSNHLSELYRRAFGFNGIIYKCGYPKNDQMVTGNTNITKRVRENLSLDQKKIVLYAPTFRDEFEDEQSFDFTVFNIDVNRVLASLSKRFGGDWLFLVKWHPILAPYIKKHNIQMNNTLDVTNYQDMQELIMTANVLISDYSSCLFDAALKGIPCFTFATDFDRYKKGRGVYYNMEDLPFPWAQNNDKLEESIICFDENEYYRKWDLFKEKTGLVETGHSAIDIAKKIIDYIDGKQIVWN